MSETIFSKIISEKFQALKFMKMTTFMPFLIFHK